MQNSDNKNEKTNWIPFCDLGKAMGKKDLPGAGVVGTTIISEFSPVSLTQMRKEARRGLGLKVLKLEELASGQVY